VLVMTIGHKKQFPYQNPGGKKFQRLKVLISTC